MSMKCPTCKRPVLQKVTLEESLLANRCDKCEGNWIASEQYWSWLDAHSETLPEKEPEVSFEINDSQKAKLCPQCNRILIKYKVGRGTNFHLDHCSSCNGVWFDKNEWETLKARNLHDEIHCIFTQSWQRQVRQEEIEENLDLIYTQKFGSEDYQELQKIKAWLNDRPQKLALLAYLNDENPYKLSPPANL
ncbi:zf-TFIIB domain-containing protein [Lusitaniella coriacea]|uniref:TFIIB-type zinc ribbon-containing protein n=1 Tax=Lusitaniella coriacea TaxID=1983105 RepID=UPI003CEC54A1